MNRKIKEFAEEKFSYELPVLLISPSSLTIETGEDGVGSFTISYENRGKYGSKKITGFIACSDYRFTFDTLEFEDNEVTINYQFDYLSAFHSYEGQIGIVTDCGEITLPYKVLCKKEEFSYENTAIKDLYQFTSFARKNFDNAVNFFYDDSFDKKMLSDNRKAVLIRHGLLKNQDKRRALEEFLCYMGTKEPVKLVVPQTSYNYHVSVPVQDQVIIKKENWGYVKAEIIVEGEFIRVNRREIGSENFIFDNYELLVDIVPSRAIGNKSEGKIIIRTMLEDVEIDINLVRSGGQEELKERKKRFECKAKIIELYFKYRLGTISAGHTDTAMRTICYGLKNDDKLIDYVDIYLTIIAGDFVNARTKLIALNNDVITPEDRLIRLYLLYLTGENRIMEMKKLSIVKGYESALIFLLYMEPAYENFASHLDYIRNLYAQGLNSPFLFLEAWKIFTLNPECFDELNEFNIRTVDWALKHEVFSNAVIKKFVGLIDNLSLNNPLLLKNLKKIYEINQDKEVIKAICRLFMNSDVSGVEEHKWIEKGIKDGVRLAGIYEAYARTMTASEEYIEPSVFSYFINNNSLNGSRKAILYSNLIKNKVMMPTTYFEYREQIESFAKEQIKKGEVSDCLFTIYNDILKDKNVVKEISPYLSKIMFKEKYICKNKKLESVTIYTDGIEESATFKISDCVAFADVPGGLSADLVSDQYGNIYPADEFCSKTRLIDYKDFLRYEENNSLQSLTTIVAEGTEGVDLTAIYEKLLSSEEITLAYKYFIKDRLIAENLNDENFLYNLLENYNFSEGNLKVSELVLSKNLYPLSLYALRNIGIERADYRQVSKVIHSYVEDEDLERKEKNFSLMINSAYKVMLGKNADEDILIFLRDNYKGRMIGLYLIYRELKDKDLLSEAFVRRTLEQMLFSENILIEASQMFEYLEPFGMGILRKAFLSYIAYKWLLKDIRPDDCFNRKISEEAYRTKNYLFILSYLKLLSEKNSLSEKEKKFVDVWLEKLVTEGIILPFYPDFADKCKLPAELENLKFISFNADNTAEVSINYRITEDDYTVEWMKNVYQGIFVKEFLIFVNEVVQYYISVKDDNEIHIVSSGELDTGDESLDETSGISMFSQINTMYLCREISDEKTLKECMKNYVVQRKIIKDIFGTDRIEEF